VDGFRQGKVPRNIFEKKYGTGDIISKAMEEMIDVKYKEAIIKDKLLFFIKMFHIQSNNTIIIYFAFTY